MIIGLSDRAAAKLADCTHRTIAKAKETGRLAKLPDGSVSRASLEKWNADRGPARGGYHRSVSAEVSGAPSPALKEIPAPVASLVALAKAMGVDAAEAVLRRVDDEVLARAVADDLTGCALAAAAELTLEDFAPPPGYDGWGKHPLFAGKPPHEDPIEWAEMVADAAASRKASK